jgi:hypothetical protein
MKGRILMENKALHMNAALEKQTNIKERKTMMFQLRFKACL